MEAISKLQPHRTMNLRGFDRRGAAAALHQASASGFTVSGVFRDVADFAVLILWDADNGFEHPSMRYLPDFAFDGVVLDFDLAATNLQPIESLKYESIDWGMLDFIDDQGDPGQIPLAACITSRTGRTSATGTWTLNGSPQPYDRVTLWFQNYAFDFIVPGGLGSSAEYWWQDAGTTASISVGSATYTYNVTTKGGETGAQIAAGVAAGASGDPLVSFTASSNFVNFASKANTGAVVNVQGYLLWLITDPPLTVIAKNIATQINSVAWPNNTPVKITATASGAAITITANAGTYGAAGDGIVTLYEQHKTSTLYFTPAGAAALRGGLDSTSVHVSINFATNGATRIRQAWLTFAPKLPHAQPYVSQEWSAVFSNWTITDPNGRIPLKVAGPGSVRVGSRDARVQYSGSSWAEMDSAEGFYWHGFAHRATASGDSVTIHYTCQYAHDLYLGTSLYTDRAKISVTIDGAVLAQPLDLYLNVEPPVVTRRLLEAGLAAGAHTVVLTQSGTANPASSGTYFHFDFLEAAVRSDVPAPPTSYPNVTAALDYDTDQTYKLSPQRLLWNLDLLGLHGPLNEYLGVFWWNRRERVGGSVSTTTVTFSGWSGLTGGGVAWLQFGGRYQNDTEQGTLLGKTSFPLDSDDGVAAHFAAFINSMLVGVFATANGNVLTITTFSWFYEFALWAWTDATSGPVGSVSVSGALGQGTEGTWTVDDTVSPPLNRAATDWHAELFAGVAAKGWTIATSLSMEVVNPPDNPPSHVWSARFADGAAVETATGFNNLVSTQCSFTAAVRAYQAVAFTQIAQLQASAGLTPWLQFGEFLWWYFAQNGSMAYYDTETASAVHSALGRPLASFSAPTSDPSVNGYADANWLRERIKTHIDAIRTAVLAAVPGAKFELLWPYDVNYPASNQYNVGGQLNRYVNLPAEYQQQSGSGLDRLKIEALSFGSQERNFTKALASMKLPSTAPLSWPASAVGYLIPWFNGGCPWDREWLAVTDPSLSPAWIGFWAIDHLCSFGWPLPLPVRKSNSQVY